MRNLWSLRTRITVASVLVLGLVLGTAAVVLVRLQERALDQSIDAGLSIRTDDVEAKVRSGSLESILAVGDDEIAAVQVFSA